MRSLRTLDSFLTISICLLSLDFQDISSYNLWDPSKTDMANLSPVCVADCSEGVGPPCLQSKSPHLLAAKAFVLRMDFDFPWGYTNALRPLWGNGLVWFIHLGEARLVFSYVSTKTTYHSRFNRKGRLFEPSYLPWKQKLKNSRNANGNHSTHFFEGETGRSLA